LQSIGLKEKKKSGLGLVGLKDYRIKGEENVWIRISKIKRL